MLMQLFYLTFEYKLNSKNYLFFSKIDHFVRNQQFVLTTIYVGIARKDGTACFVVELLVTEGCV